MRIRVLSLLVLSAGLTLPAMPLGAVTIDWVPVGDPGNTHKVFCQLGMAGFPCGGVAYEYSSSKYEVTNAQYAEFLNAKAASDPLQLYHPSMGSDVHGGIVREGSDGSYTYTVKPGFENKPVNFVSAFDAMRFANWLNNGQGNADTEAGAYTLLGGTPIPSNGGVVGRNPDATIALATASEWYKAAYYDAVSGTYFRSAAASNQFITCAVPGPTPNTANCLGVGPGPTPGLPHTVTDVGAYTGSPSPYGTFDQEGNLFEWTEERTPNIFGGSPGTNRLAGGGAFTIPSPGLDGWASFGPSTQSATTGFRVVSLVPEPGTIGLLLMGLAGLSVARRRP
ncbi:MAG: SUMF1/EgtB/PvdO family nonheme iron enzyme [Pseudomonadota bacterium]